jgi:lysophospholipase L1-like esterase
MNKRILCFGDSNTWGWVPLSMGDKRFNNNERWTGLLAKELKDYTIIEEGLGARTTMFDDPRPEYPNRNGLNILPILLETHLPLNWVIIMLGTTDTKQILNKTSEEIANGVKRLIKTIKEYRHLSNFQETIKILLVVPPIVNENAEFAKSLFLGGEVKGRLLVSLYQKIALEEGIFFLNPSNSVIVDKNEGVHLDKENHKLLFKLILNKIQEVDSV